METAIIDPTTLAPFQQTQIPVSYPLNQFERLEVMKLKGRRWIVADVRNRMGMILVPQGPTRTEDFWQVGELLPLKSYWFRVAVVGREGIVLSLKEPVSE